MSEHTQVQVMQRPRAALACAALVACMLAPQVVRADVESGTGTFAAAAAPGASALSPLQSKTSMLPSLASADVTSLYQGTTIFTTLSFARIELPVAQSGTFQISLTDLLFPQANSTLSFALVDGDSVLGVIDGSGSLQYSLVTSGPKTLFGYTYAVATPGVNAGAYSLNVDYAPVPLPAAAWLLLSGLGLVGYSARRTAGPVIRRSYK
jgi:hypothetical protein